MTDVRGDEARVQLLEVELREYSERMAEAERIAGFGVWKWEIATGTVRWSDQLHAIYGLPPGEFEGTVEGFVSRLHPEDRDRVGGHIAHAVETLEPFAFEERIVRPDGSVRTLLSQGRAIPGPDGTAAALVGVCHDVTDRAAAEHALGASERPDARDPRQLAIGRRGEGSRGPLPDDQRGVRACARRPQPRC